MTTTDESVLLSRVTDRTAGLDDWEALTRSGRDDPDLWRRLAEVLKDDTTLRLAVGSELAVADEVTLGGGGSVDVVAPVHGESSRSAWRGWRVASGWAAALLVAIAWSVASWAAPGASSTPELTPRDAPAAPMADQGPGPSAAEVTASDPVADEAATTLVHAFPLEVVQTRAVPDGDALEVLYLRQSLERRVVTGAYALAEDELGFLQPVPVELAAITVSDTL